jgi:hypothetical protein
MRFIHGSDINLSFRKQNSRASSIATISMVNSKRFRGKFTGAKARLFAHVCKHYSFTVEDACNDTPDEHPIFSWLSPQQRLKLVHEVMVGLLCLDEPLPPETIQHYTAYLALVATIRTEIEVEIDNICIDAGSVGDDLLDGYNDTTDGYRRQTPEEREERNRNIDLISRQAEKNKEKIDRAEPAGTNTSPVEEFQAPAEAEFNLLDSMQRFTSTMSVLFTGPPVSAEARRLHRPLTEMEEWVFCWRRLVDDALQEHTTELHWPLCNVDFDWRCQKPQKWAYAINLLMVIHHGADITPLEQALVEGKIGEMEYADRLQHARIHAIEKIVKDLRDSYDPFWKPDLLAVDQRAIFAVCASEIVHSAEHFAWATAFLATCEEQGVDFSAGGDYQKRLEIYRRMPPLYNEELSMSYHNGFGGFESAETPADFTRDDPIHAMCHVHDCYSSTPKEALKLCSRCKVVSYCSRECQMKDWPDHKKHCKVLAELRKDKAKVSEIVKNF